ncbi:hypothetical protein PHYSODRAFT_292853 [Phytophthora sojae]|uniref:Uncharacterized protein n=1 Tax=Phytophthora sojae (strain P6497) TaxID=1094619 RepID=G4YGI8_PHYSP|nr:hypothetical protein PHYSODRAFT_292853 [Phytophthora sojae]EGZ26523.1 hypothetical protein PHYSODRAFT_292853 [Phytophthora sojae]|eukprot:XP_009513798.1 hypothetical protein PHYSODRAFT_292853 [Phytophthora sojae]
MNAGLWSILSDAFGGRVGISGDALLDSSGDAEEEETDDKESKRMWEQRPIHLLLRNLPRRRKVAWRQSQHRWGPVLLGRPLPLADCCTAAALRRDTSLPRDAASIVTGVSDEEERVDSI